MTCKEEFGCCISAGQVCEYISYSSHQPFLQLILFKGLYYRFTAVSIKMPMNRTKTNSSKIGIKPHKTPDSESNQEKKEQSWRDYNL